MIREIYERVPGKSGLYQLKGYAICDEGRFVPVTNGKRVWREEPAGVQPPVVSRKSSEPWTMTKRQFHALVDMMLHAGVPKPPSLQHVVELQKAQGRR
jgi:hypothetical protein